jgi:hypothetical protein
VSRGPGRLQAGIMAVMRNHGGYWTAANLAQALLASRSVAATSSVRRALLKLERQGLISAEPAAGGIRFWQLTETELKRRKREERKQRRQAHEEAKFHSIFDELDRKMVKANDPAKLKLAKTLGLLGSDRDGEILSAARAAERQRKELDLSWAVLRGLQE